MARRGATTSSSPTTTSSRTTTSTTKDAVHDTRQHNLQRPSAFLEANRAAPLRVVSTSAGEFREALDDAFVRVLQTDFAFREDHTHSNVRLLLGYLACAVMGYGTFVSLRVPFDDCKLQLFASVLGYIVLNFAMTQYTSLVERDTVFVGDNNTLRLHVQFNSEFLRFSETYRAVLRITDPVTRKTFAHRIDSRLGQFFDVGGFLAADTVVQEVRYALRSASSQGT